MNEKIADYWEDHKTEIIQRYVEKHPEKASDMIAELDGQADYTPGVKEILETIREWYSDHWEQFFPHNDEPLD